MTPVQDHVLVVEVGVVLINIINSGSQHLASVIFSAEVGGQVTPHLLLDHNRIKLSFAFQVNIAVLTISAVM